ncbi:MAG: PilZ domain-containing protein [Planctomycetota bacterium]|nr:PilZ domain-containing protein [Planctomycetota bacterium]
MESGEKREALRVPCDFPVRVYGQLRELSGRMLDISRTGMRIELPLSRLMMQPSLDFAALTQALEQMLGATFMADLHHEMLGQLIRKKLRTVRVGEVDPDADLLEVGCSFEEPLRDEETVMLGIGLPPVGETSAAAFRNVPPPKRRGDADEDQPAQPRPLGYEGILHPSEGIVGEPLVGRTEGMLGSESLLAVPVNTISGAYDVPPEPLAAALRDILGPKPRLEILDGLHMVWSGPVQLDEIEMPSSYAGDVMFLLRDAT